MTIGRGTIVAAVVPLVIILPLLLYLEFKMLIAVYFYLNFRPKGDVPTGLSLLVVQIFSYSG